MGVSSLREAAKKVLLLLAGPLRKNEFFLTFFSNVPKFQRPLSSRGGRGQALMARPLREVRFFAATLIDN